MSDQVGPPGNPAPSDQDPAITQALERRMAVGRSLIKVVSTRVLDPHNPDVDVMEDRHGMITQRGLDITEENSRISIDMYGERSPEEPIVEIESVFLSGMSSGKFWSVSKISIMQDGQINTTGGTAKGRDDEVDWFPPDAQMVDQDNPTEAGYNEVTEFGKRLFKKLSDYATEHGAPEEA